MYTTQDVHRAVIPVGGLGTRLLPATKVLPKELLPVGRRPMVQYVVEEMRAAGLEHICFITGRKKALIQEHFDHDPELVRHLQDLGRDELLAELAYLESGLHLSYVRQSGPQGLADAVSLAHDFAGQECFVVALGDSIVFEPEMGTLLHTMIEQHLQAGAAATIAVEAVPPEKVRYYGIVRPSGRAGDAPKAFDVCDIVEKPRPDQTPSNWAVAARFVFSPDIFPAIQDTTPGRGGEVQLSDAIRVLVQQGARVRAVPLSGLQRRYDIGSFAGYFRAFLEFALMDERLGSELRTYLEDANRRLQATDGTD